MPRVLITSATLALLESRDVPEEIQARESLKKNTEELQKIRDLQIQAKERMDILNADPRYHNPATMKQAIDDFNAGRLTPEQDVYQSLIESPSRCTSRTDEWFKHIQRENTPVDGAIAPLWERAVSIWPDDPQNKLSKSPNGSARRSR